MRGKISWNHSLVWKITISYLCLTAIPFIFSYLLTSVYWWNETKENSYNHSSDNLKSSKQLLKIYIEQMEALSTSLYYNNDLGNLIKNTNILSDDNEKLKLFQEFDKLFLNTSPSRPDKFNFYFFSLSGSLIYSYNGGFWSDIFPEIDADNQSKLWFIETVQKNGRTHILTEGAPYQNANRPVFSISKLIKLSKAPQGVVLLEFNFNSLNQFFGKSFIENKGNFLITNSEGVILYHDGMLPEEILPQKAQEFHDINGSGSKKILINDERYFMVYDSLDEYSLNLIHLTPTSVLLANNLKNMLMIHLFIMPLMIILVILSIYYFYKNLHPLRNLSYKMEQYIQKPSNQPFPISTKDEIGLLGTSFNNMIDRIQDLIKKDYRNKFILLETEKKMLEAQINPHFLYNTLDTIRFKALEQNNKEIADMLFILSANLRYTITESNSLVFVEDEIRWLERYIYLQKLRFEDRFEVEFSIDPKIIKMKIHRLILQPFIENAIMHGFKNLEHGGQLKIKGDLTKEGILIFEIIDNGCGFDQEINKIIDMNSIKEFQPDKIGMYNALNRLFLYYENSCEVILTSSPGNGTFIKIKLYHPREWRK
ncbi:sensor histidine kinase [Bacillus sp. J14TS2]|uniref:cache domain-containing sensor histidine kinase n=1 Tax=Bacillus sp. J14TS2 TaxID=2807188 RepID=UPI001B2E29A3|nr:sensor histidine kinase [Bacillus sp. J14TS2]GIN71578.1 sensor histidine kinase [Bacillus sp. J14TS2]